MRSSIRRVGFPVALLVTACVQGGSLSLADRDAASLAIAQNYRAYETALNNADAGAIAALYTADGVFLRADTTENVRGTAALHAYLTALFGDSTRYSGTSIPSIWSHHHGQYCGRQWDHDGHGATGYRGAGRAKLEVNGGVGTTT